MNIRGYAASCRMFFIDMMAFPIGIVMSSLYMALFFFILTQVWLTIYGQGSSLEGMSVVAMIWYLCIAEATTVAATNPQNEIAKEIISGSVAHELNKPYDYFLLRFVKSMVEVSVKTFVVLTVGFFIAWLAVGLPEVSVTGILLTIASMFLANTVAFLGRGTIGLLAFMFENVDGLAMSYVTMELILGGIFFPLDMFPPAIAAFTKWTPFAASIYWPAHIFVNPGMNIVLEAFTVQLVWILILAILSRIVFAIGVRKVQIHGG